MMIGEFPAWDLLSAMTETDLPVIR